MKKVFIFQGKELVYELTDKNVKNINLRIQRDGKVVVSKHKRVSMEQVEAFLCLKWEWIFAAIDKMKKAERIQSRPTTLDAIRLFGKVIPIVEKVGIKRLQLIDGGAFFYTNQNDFEKKLKELQSLLEKQLVQHIENKRVEYDKVIRDYGISVPKIKYRYMKGKWGSCETKNGVITMNYNLLYYSKEAIDYVLLHEYAHLIVPNHSKRFYDFLAFHMPDYKKRESLLKI